MLLFKSMLAPQKGLVKWLAAILHIVVAIARKEKLKLIILLKITIVKH